MNRTFCTEIIFLKGFMKMENLIFCLNATIPIFLTLMLGLFFRKIGLFDDTFVSRLNKFVFNAALPALLFLDIAKSDFYCVEYEICIVLLLCHTDQYRNFHRTFLSAETAKYPGRIYPGFLPEQRCDPWNCNYPESLRKRRNGTAYDHRKCAAL